MELQQETNGHKQNSNIQDSLSEFCFNGVWIDRYQIWWLGYQLEILILKYSILKEAEVLNKLRLYWLLSLQLGFKVIRGKKKLPTGKENKKDQMLKFH